MDAYDRAGQRSVRRCYGYLDPVQPAIGRVEERSARSACPHVKSGGCDSPETDAILHAHRFPRLTSIQRPLDSPEGIS